MVVCQLDSGCENTFSATAFTARTLSTQGREEWMVLVLASSMGGRSERLRVSGRWLVAQWNGMTCDQSIIKGCDGAERGPRGVTWSAGRPFKVEMKI